MIVAASCDSLYLLEPFALARPATPREILSDILNAMVWVNCSESDWRSSFAGMPHRAITSRIHQDPFLSSSSSSFLFTNIVDLQSRA